ncbi:hypothetical protein [Pseudonocardia sp.]|uniref:hypothetical protein n=1 Tax=Pseudonocardia sp. TaxID=60912 RepID=UPI003D0E0EF7
MDLLPGLHRRDELRAVGYTSDEVRRARAAGLLTSLRRGTYRFGPAPPTPEAAHALLVRAAVRELSGDSVVSHVSAAVLHGLPVWGVPLDRVHVTRPRRNGARSGARAEVHAAPLADDETCRIDGLRVTSLSRTLVDVARWVPFMQAVVVLDAALRRAALADGAPEAAPGPAWATLKAASDVALRRAHGWQGAPHARRAAAFADWRSESPGESRSRVALLDAGLPAPELQGRIPTALGEPRADFLWREQRTVGEFDGLGKYGRLLRPGESVADAVLREKRREDAIRAEGWWVVRWTWAELEEFGPVLDRLRRAFSAAERSRLGGTQR